MRRKWNRAKLKEAIKSLIQQPNVTVRRYPLKKNLAQSTWHRDGKHIVIRIYVDDTQVGLISSVVHELLHIAAEEELAAFDTEVEEWTVNGWESNLFKHIASSRSQLAWWRNAIERRMK